MARSKKSPAQQAAATADALLREHFPAFVIILPPESEDDDSPPHVLHRGHHVFWTGLLARAYEEHEIEAMKSDAEEAEADDDEEGV